MYTMGHLNPGKLNKKFIQIGLIVYCSSLQSLGKNTDLKKIV